MRTPPEMTCGFLIQLVFCKKKTMWFIGVEVEQETSARPPKKNPGSAPVWFLSFTKIFSYTPSSLVHTASIEMKSCIKWSLTGG